MMQIPQASRPRELIYFTSIELSTVQDGIIRMFLIMDGYSEFIFHVGAERGDDMEYVLKQVQQLINNKDFNRYSNQPFILAMSDYEEYREQIESLIHPIGGTMLVDEDYVMSRMAPVIENFLASVTKNSR